MLLQFPKSDAGWIWKFVEKTWTDFRTLDKILENNPFMTAFLGDNNSGSNNRCKAGITFLEGSKIDAIAYIYGLDHLIQERTHILNSSPSCIDLNFASRRNSVMESGFQL